MMLLLCSQDWYGGERKAKLTWRIRCAVKPEDLLVLMISVSLISRTELLIISLQGYLSLVTSLWNELKILLCFIRTSPPSLYVFCFEMRSLTTREERNSLKKGNRFLFYFLLVSKLEDSLKKNKSFAVKRKWLHIHTRILQVFRKWRKNELKIRREGVKYAKTVSEDIKKERDLFTQAYTVHSFYSLVTTKIPLFLYQVLSDVKVNQVWVWIPFVFFWEDIWHPCRAERIAIVCQCIQSVCSLLSNCSALNLICSLRTWRRPGKRTRSNKRRILQGYRDTDYREEASVSLLHTLIHSLPLSLTNHKSLDLNNTV